MLHSILSLRWVTLVAALGAALGAMLMFFEGCLKLAYALEMVLQPSAATDTSVIATVMQATDAFLFGLVLIVFAYAITFGFAFNLPTRACHRLIQSSVAARQRMPVKDEAVFS
jgi:uncharacterized membrane protein YqhA